MKWQQQINNDSFHCLKIDADWSELADDYNDILEGYRKAQLPGFRPGKVPKRVIEKRFKKEISEQLTQQVAQRLGREAVREAGIKVLGQAEVEEIECQKGSHFSARIRFHPITEIILPDLNTLINGDSDDDPRDLISLNLLAHLPFDIPDEVVQDELAHDGISNSKPGNAEWQAAKDSIRLMLILKEIAGQEGIEVEPRDVDNRITEKAEEFGSSEAALRAELSQGDGMQRLKDILLAEVTLEYLLEINAV